MNCNFHYALVAYNVTPLAEYSLLSGNYKKIALKILQNVNPKIPYSIVEQGDFVFATFTDINNLTFLCLSDKGINQDLRILFLKELQREWNQKYGNDGYMFTEDSKNLEFGNAIIAELIHNFNNENSRKLSMIKENLNQAQEQMTQNLTNAFVRGEQLNVMEEKAEILRDSSRAFHREAARVRRMLCFEKYKWCIFGSLIIVVLIFLIILTACGGFGFHKCR